MGGLKSTVRRVTRSIASEAEQYVDEKLEAARKAYDLEERSGVDRLVDACKVRTGILLPCGKEKSRVINWRDVRMGLVTDLDGQEKRYVGKVDSYPKVVRQLFSLAVIPGLSSKTEVIAPADGGIGLREELERQFPRIQFILDRSHLEDHFFDTAEALGYDAEGRKEWVNAKLLSLFSQRIAPLSFSKY